MKGNPNLILLESLLSRCRDGVLSREIPVIIPLGQARPRPPEFGQFHLQTELFYQVSGSTCFQFPTSEYILGPNRVLLVPPLVTHYEKVRGPDAEFQNLAFFEVSRRRALEIESPQADVLENPQPPGFFPQGRGRVLKTQRQRYHQAVVPTSFSHDSPQLFVGNGGSVCRYRATCTFGRPGFLPPPAAR